MERLRKACQLSWADWRYLGHAFLLFLMLEIALRLLSFGSVLALCRHHSHRTHRIPAAPPSVERLAWLTSVAGRYAVPHPTCLKQALVLSVLLARQGITTDFRIGVARQAGDFGAHAWLEQDGRVILGLQDLDRYEPLASLSVRN